MPFIKRSVSPVRLASKAVSEEDKFDLNIVCNNALVSALKQLASLAYHAEGLFADLNDECQDILLRTNELNQRVHNLENHVDKLDFRTVTIPVGDLEKFEQLEEHFKSEKVIERNLFTPSSRPECVIESYQDADPNPARIIRQCNPYRRDGRTGSTVFSPTPTITSGVPEVISEEHVLGKSAMAYGEPDQHSRRRSRIPYDRPRSMAVLPTNPDLVAYSDDEERMSIRQLSASQPADLVPIDTSGTNFNRMCQYRESLKSASHECMGDTSTRTSRRRHRRRQTVSGLPNQVHDKLSQAFFDAVDRDARSLSRDRLERPHSMAYLDRYAPRDERFYKSREELRRDRIEREKSVDREEKTNGGLARSCSLRRSMRSLFKGAPDKEKSQSMDLWADGRPKSPGPFMVDVSGRRSRSLPRSLKSVKQSVSKFMKNRSSSTEGRLDDPHCSEHAMKDPFVANEYVTHVVKPKSKGLLRSMTMRMSKSQSSVASVSASGGSSSKRQPRSSSKKNKKGEDKRRSSSGARPQSMYVGQSGTPTRGRPQHPNQHHPHNQQRNHHPQHHHSQPIHQHHNSPQHQHHRGAPIPIQSPMTPQSIHQSQPPPPYVPPAPMAYNSSGRKINIPPGNAWRAFGEVNYRQNPQNRYADRQSSSGNWSATDSMRYSTDSAKTVPDSSSFSSHDRDSAVFCNSGFPYMGRYAERLKSDTLSTVTSVSEPTTSINDDISTVNGDAATLNGEESDGTLHGSVVSLSSSKEGSKSSNEKDKATAPGGADDKAHKSREKRKKRRSRNKNAEAVANTTDSNGLTVQNMKAHDKVFRTTVSGGKVPDDDGSLYSVDQDGFYTSMHKDCGLKQSTFDMIEEASEAINGQNGSALGQRSKKPPPPPPPRKTSFLSNGDSSPSNSQNNLANQRVFSQSAASLNSLNDQLDRIQIHSSTLSLVSIKSSDSKSSKVSDPESMSKRVQTKTNISSSAYPTICSVTPTNSDDEKSPEKDDKNPKTKASKITNVTNNDKPTFKMPQNPVRNVKPSLNPICETGYDKLSNKAKAADMKLKPGQGPSSAFEKGPRQNSFRMMVNAMLESSYEKSDRSMDDSSISLEIDFAGMDLIDTSVYAKLPIKPNAEPAKNNTQSEGMSNMDKSDITQQKSIAKPPQKALTPKTPIQLEGFSTRSMLPDVKTPDDVLDGRPYAANSTFESQPSVESKFTFPETKDKSLERNKESPKKTKKKKRHKSESRSSKEKITTEVTKVKEQPVLNDSFDSSTWPKKKSAVRAIDDISSEQTTKSYTDPDDKLSWTNSFPRRKSKDRSRSRTVEVPSSLPFGDSVGKPLAPIMQSPTHDTDEQQPLVSALSIKRSKSAGRISMGVNAKMTSPKKVVIATNPVAPPSPSKTPSVSSSVVPSEHVSTATKLSTSQSSVAAVTSPIQAAPARLIISSPVSNQAAYVSNPHRRSVCSPVSERDFEAFSFQNVDVPTAEKPMHGNMTITPNKNIPSSRALSPQRVEIPDFINRNVVKSQTMFEFSSPPMKESQVDQQCLTPDGNGRPLSKPLYESISAMKHSITFPYSTKHSSDKSNNNSNNKNTWYGGLADNKDSKKKDSTKNSPVKKQLDINVNEHRLSSAGYPFAQFLDDGYLCTLDTSETYDKRWSGYSMISTSSTTSSGSGKQSDNKKTSSSSLSKPAADTLSVGSTQSKDSGNSVNSRTSGGSLLSAFRQRRSTADKTSLSLNLKEKCKMKRGGTSASNLPLPSLAAVFSGKSKTKKNEPVPVEIEEKSVTKKDDNTPGPLSSTLLSPSKLKRSSAVLDEEFDIFSVEIPEATAAELDNSIHIGSPPRKSDLIIEYLHSKRQCTSPTNTPQHNSSPSRIAIARRHRLRRSVSKGKLSRNSSFSSMENMLSSPAKSPRTEENKPFVFGSTQKLDLSFTRGDKKNSSREAGTVSSGASSSNNSAKVFTSPQKQDTKMAKTTKLSTSVAETPKPNPAKELEQFKLGKPTLSPKKQRSVGNAKEAEEPKKSKNSSSPKPSKISRLPTPMKTRNEGLSLSKKTESTNGNTETKTPELAPVALFKDGSVEQKKGSSEKPKTVTQNGTRAKSVTSPSESRRSILKTSTSQPMKKANQSSVQELNKNNLVSNDKSTKNVNKDSLTNKPDKSTFQPKTKSAFDTAANKEKVTVKPTPLKFTPPKSSSVKPSINTKEEQSNTAKTSVAVNKSPKVIKGDVSSQGVLLNPAKGRTQNTKVSVASVVDLKVDSSQKTQQKSGETVSKSGEHETMDALQPVKSLLKSSSTLDLNTDQRPLSRELSHGSIGGLNQRTSLTVYTSMNKTSSMTKSLSNLSCLSLLKDSTSVVYDSEMSLAKSTDSLSSHNTATERTRSAKLAFLTQQGESEALPQKTVDDRFSKHKIGTDSKRSESSKSNNRNRSSSCSNVKNNALNTNGQNKLTNIGGLVNGHV